MIGGRPLHGMFGQQVPGAADISSTGLVGYWRLNEGTGTAAVSETANHQGTLTGSPTWVSGKTGTGVSFNGTSHYINVTSTSAFNLTGVVAVSVMAWINCSTTASTRRILSYPTNQTSGYEKYSLMINAGTLAFTTGWISNDRVTSVAYTTTGSWTHVCGVRTTTQIILYVDGAQAGTPTAFTQSFDSTANGDFQIGRFGPTWGQYFSGTIDDVRVYSRAISASEVTQVYDLG